MSNNFDNQPQRLAGTNLSHIERQPHSAYRTTAIGTARKFIQDTEKDNKDFVWLQTRQSIQQFADLIFRYKNQIYAIIVIPAEIRQEEKINKTGMGFQMEMDLMFPASNEVKILRDAAKKYNLIPCFFVTDKAGISIPYRAGFDGWGLFDLRIEDCGGELKTINPNKISTSEKIPMSDWEKYDFAIQVIRNYIIDELGGKIGSCQSVPEINPQIFFWDKYGVISWVVVRYFEYPAKQAIKPNVYEMKQAMNNTPYSNSIGYYAEVGICNAANANDIIHRGDGLNVGFTGLQVI